MSAAALVLAAGEGTRMRSALPKVAHTILGVPMVRYAIDAARDAGCDRIVVVTGYGAETVETLIPGETCVRQEQQLGTGHAVMCAQSLLGDVEGPLVVLSGDTPLLRPATIQRLIEAREGSGAAAVVLTATLEDPTGYGRIVREDDGGLGQIVEQKDLAPEQHAIREVNTGTYCFDARALFAHLHALGNHNAQGEYYLTDVIGVLRKEGHTVVDVETDDPLETLGVNTRVQLAEATRVLQRRINREHMLAGVTMTDPELVWVGPEVRLGRDVVLEPMTFLLGRTEVHEGCLIGPDTRIVDSTVEAGSVVDSSIVLSSSLGPETTIGPRAYVRPGTVVRARGKVGAS
ncbi:MAG: bifunctional UDP-N-acetylglucosamine diphosphorylase/glucosamine-1-phosphate N-acetyltransferase GlmU, partial [Coriobacteriales bacterium]